MPASNASPDSSTSGSDDARTDPPVRMTVVENGPLKVEGPIRIEAHDGTTVPVREGRAAYLCRCGGSKNKPFCDGAHSKIGFAGAEAAVAALDAPDSDG